MIYGLNFESAKLKLVSHTSVSKDHALVVPTVCNLVSNLFEDICRNNNKTSDFEKLRNKGSCENSTRWLDKKLLPDWKGRKFK
jgi:hypothetical protein